MPYCLRFGDCPAVELSDTHGDIRKDTWLFFAPFTEFSYSFLAVVFASGYHSHTNLDSIVATCVDRVVFMNVEETSYALQFTVDSTGMLSSHCTSRNVEFPAA